MKFGHYFQVQLENSAQISSFYSFSPSYDSLRRPVINLPSRIWMIRWQREAIRARVMATLCIPPPDRS